MSFLKPKNGSVFMNDNLHVVIKVTSKAFDGNKTSQSRGDLMEENCVNMIGKARDREGKEAYVCRLKDNLHNICQGCKG